MIHPRRTRGQRRNDQMFHYCAADALGKITTERTLRFSDLTMTNDAEDWEWGKRILDDALRKVPGPGPGTLPEEERVKYILSRIEAIAPESNLFVACFSNDGNKLSQWRAYADNCRGYSVGFIPSSLGHVTGSSVKNVLYPHHLQTEEIQKLVKEIKGSSRYRVTAQLGASTDWPDSVIRTA